MCYYSVFRGDYSVLKEVSVARAIDTVLAGTLYVLL